MIETKRLGRSFGDGAETKHALHDLDFSVERGETRGLLGPNGAGKTTLVRILSTILTPTTGTATIAGHDVVDDPRAVRQRVRLSLGGDRGVHFGLSVFENVRFWATMYGLGWREGKQTTTAVLERVGLGDVLQTRADALSRGMKQRLHLARALVAPADVMLLDEPTTGMDPVAAREFRGLIKELKAEGRTILLTTHNMAEAEDLSDRITLLNEGRIEVTDSPQGLRSLFDDRITVHAAGAPAELQSTAEALDCVEAVRVAADQWTVDVVGDPAPVLTLLVQAGVVNIRSEPPSLEDVYLRVFDGRGMST